MKVVACLLLLLVAVSAVEDERQTLSHRADVDTTQRARLTLLSTRAQSRRAGQGVLTTRSFQMAREDGGRRGVQENEWNSDDEGGTSVVLSNLNSVSASETDIDERIAVQEAREKTGQEQAKKERENNQRKDDSLDARKKNEKDNQEWGQKLAEEREKRESQAQKENLDESKKKREAREEQSQKQEKQFQEQAQKRNTELAAESKAKSDKITEQANKKRQQEDQDRQASIRRPAWRLEFNKIIRGGDLPFTGAYTYMFWVRPRQIVGNWGNILHKGQENVNRNPAVWFYPGSLRLHIRSGTAAQPNWENGGNAGCDPEAVLPLNQWTHVCFVHDSWGLKVYYNGNNVCAQQIGGPRANSGPLYLSDPWHDVAQAELADLRYYPAAVHTDVLARVIDAKEGIE